MRVCSLFLILSAPFLSQEARSPVPDPAAQKDAEKVIRDVFKEDYAKRGAPDKLALARKLLDQALQTKDDLNSRFVLFREAEDLAVQAGSIDLALQAIGEWSRLFQIDGGTLRSQAFAGAEKNAKTPEEFKALAAVSLKLANEASVAEDYDAATKLLATSAALAKRSKDVPLISRINARTREITELKTKFDAVRKARETLAATPEDGAAKTVVGWHLCAAKGDWEGGLALLAGGTDEALKSAASKDLAKPAAAPDQASLGDLWWDLAEKRPGDREALRRRAALWYEQAMTGLSGLSKVRLEKRVAEVRSEQLVREGWVDVTDPTLFGLPGRPGDPLVLTVDLAKPRSIELSKFPPGEFDAFSIHFVFGKVNDGQVKIQLENEARELFVQNGSVWYNGFGTEFMHKGTKQEEYTISGTLVPGQYVFTLDGKEVGRGKTSRTRLTTFLLMFQNGQFRIDQIRLRRRD